MKPARRSIKRPHNPIESSDEDVPQKKKSPDPKPVDLSEESSSDSDIGTYLRAPSKLDLDSSFFKPIEKNVAENRKSEEGSGLLGRLSDTDSSDDELDQVIHGSNTNSSEYTEVDSGIPSTSTANDFQHINEYNKKFEEAKKAIETYEAKKRLEGTESMDIDDILQKEEQEFYNSLDSSGFETLSENEDKGDWEEVDTKENRSLIPREGVQITIDLPGDIRKKKSRSDLMASIKRRINRVKKENQVLVHKVHLLCWIAHGFYVNQTLNDENLLARALSLLPSKNCYPPNRVDLNYLGDIVGWYTKSVVNKNTAADPKGSLEDIIEEQITKKEASNYKIYTYIFICILRSLGIKCRLILSLQVEPLRPPQNELCSLSNKNQDNDKKNNRSKEDIKKTESGNTPKERGTKKTKGKKKVTFKTNTSKNLDKSLNRSLGNKLESGKSVSKSKQTHTYVKDTSKKEPDTLKIQETHSDKRKDMLKETLKKSIFSTPNSGNSSKKSKGLRVDLKNSEAKSKGFEAKSKYFKAKELEANLEGFESVSDDDEEKPDDYKENSDDYEENSDDYEENSDDYEENSYNYEDSEVFDLNSGDHKRNSNDSESNSNYPKGNSSSKESDSNSKISKGKHKKSTEKARKVEVTSTEKNSKNPHEVNTRNSTKAQNTKDQSSTKSSSGKNNSNENIKSSRSQRKLSKSPIDFSAKDNQEPTKTDRKQTCTLDAANTEDKAINSSNKSQSSKNNSNENIKSSRSQRKLSKSPIDFKAKDDQEPIKTYRKQTCALDAANTEDQSTNSSNKNHSGKNNSNESIKNSRSQRKSSKSPIDFKVGDHQDANKTDGKHSRTLKVNEDNENVRCTRSRQRNSKSPIDPKPESSKELDKIDRKHSTTLENTQLHEANKTEDGANESVRNTRTRRKKSISPIGVRLGNHQGFETDNKQGDGSRSQEIDCENVENQLRGNTKNTKEVRTAMARNKSVNQKGGRSTRSSRSTSKSPINFEEQIPVNPDAADKGTYSIVNRNKIINAMSSQNAIDVNTNKERLVDGGENIDSIKSIEENNDGITEYKKKLRRSTISPVGNKNYADGNEGRQDSMEENPDKFRKRKSKKSGLKIKMPINKCLLPETVSKNDESSDEEAFKNQNIKFSIPIIKQEMLTPKSSIEEHELDFLGFPKEGVETFQIPQLDGGADTPPRIKKTKSEKSKPNLNKLMESPKDKCPKNHLRRLKTIPNYKEVSSSQTEDNSDDDFAPSTVKTGLLKRLSSKSSTSSQDSERSRFFDGGNSSKSLSFSKSKQLDVRQDIVSIIKKNLENEAAELRLKLGKRQTDNRSKNLNKTNRDSSPELIPVKKVRKDDDFKEKSSVKVKRRIPMKKDLIEMERKRAAIKEELKKSKGVNVWLEVFAEAEEKWISVDIVKGKVHCVKEIYSRATHPISYILGFDNDNHVKDVTKRYCENWNTVTRKLRVDQGWWDRTLAPYKALRTPREREEDEDLARQQLDQPLPKTISEYKNHPLYVLKRHLLKFEAIYPPDALTLGFVRNEPVYSRDCVYVLHSRDIWLKQAKVVKPGEKPYKIVKARPKYDKLSNTVITDQMLEIFGIWQVEDYVPPTAENGIVPKNAYGNVDLFKKCMLPKGTVHLQLPGLNRVARKLNIDCAPAVTGFDFHSGWSHPVFDGFVVCEEYSEHLVAAWVEEQEEYERKEQEKTEKRIYDNWKRLIKGLLIRERLNRRYGFGTSNSKNDKSEPM